MKAKATSRMQNDARRVAKNSRIVPARSISH